MYVNIASEYKDLNRVTHPLNGCWRTNFSFDELPGPYNILLLLLLELRIFIVIMNHFNQILRVLLPTEEIRKAQFNWPGLTTCMVLLIVSD